MKVLREHALILSSILAGCFLFYLPVAYYVIQPVNQTALEALGGADIGADYTVFTLSFSSDPNFQNPAHCLEYNYVFDWASERTKQIFNIWSRFKSLSVILPILPPLLWLTYFKKFDRYTFRRAFFAWLLLIFGPIVIVAVVYHWLWGDVVFGWCRPGPHFLVKSIWPFWPTILLSLLSTGLGITAIRRVRVQETVTK